MIQYCQSPPSEVYPATSRSQYHCRHDSQLWPVWDFGCQTYGHLFTIQNGRCGGCGRERRKGGKRLSIDHNHRDGNYPRGFIRGLLCSSCNEALTEGVVALIERQGVPGPLRLPGGDVIEAKLVSYVLEPPGRALNIVMPEELVARMEERATEVARRQAEDRRSRRRRPAERPRVAPAPPPPSDDGDVDPDDRWARPPAPVPLQGSHLARKLRGTCTCEECVARRKFAAGWVALPPMNTEEEPATIVATIAPPRHRVWFDVLRKIGRRE